MDGQRRIQEIAQENTEIRKKGDMVRRGFNRTFRTLTKALSLKDEARSRIERRLKELQDLLRRNQEKLKIVARNIEIYQQNTERVNSALTCLDRDEEELKKKYQSLLAGPGKKAGESKISDEDEASCGEEPLNGCPEREQLIEKRQEFLDELAHRFQRLEEDMLFMGKLRKELCQAKKVIEGKNEEAVKKKELLEKTRDNLKEEKDRLEKELQTSVLEEWTLVQEFEKMLAEVVSSMNFSKKMEPFLSFFDEEMAPTPKESLMKYGNTLSSTVGYRLSRRRMKKS